MNRFCEDCALADGYGDCGCKPKRHEGVWECDCWEPLPPDEEETDGEDEMTNIDMVAAELDAAKKKHPFFATALIDPYAPIAWSADEEKIKQRNSHGPWYADNIILEEVAEAFAAVERGDLAHARQELAQCAAVCIRAMEYIDDEINKETTK